MQTSTYIDLLLKKYRQAPTFPFNDWTTDPVSFYALMNLWDEVFRVAAGQLSDFYIAGGEAQMDIDSLIFRVGTRDKKRRVNVHPEHDGGVFYIFTKTATDGYAPDRLHLGELPDRSELGFATDLDRNRLIAAFEMIRTYTHTDLPTLDAADALGKQFVETYRHHFGFADFDPFAGPTPDDDEDDDMSTS